MESFLKYGTYHSSFYWRIFVQNELSPKCEVRGQNLPYLSEIFSCDQYGIIGALFMSLLD